ncbi:MAG: helix-turn-helix domain-containing protein [Burkholderiales bacterium]|nr:helix-turn-helix domain-containing protein [Burkholderiales bacterium]
MSDEAGATAPAGEVTAGRLLREAREKQGLHIAALAAAIKVSPKKLEMLEADRFDALPDATFTRALAQTVCRALKTDPAPVMRLLPPPPGHSLENVGEGLNTPFRERPGVLVQSNWPAALANPAYGLALLLLIAAAVVLLLPSGFIGGSVGSARPASAAAAQGKVEPGMPPDFVGDAGTRAASGTTSVASTAASSSTAAGSSPTAAVPAATEPASAGAPVAAVAAASPIPAASATAADALPAGMLQLRTTAPSWIEVTDGRGQPLVSRLLKPGEAVGVDGAPPLRVRIGNAAGTELVFRGQPTDLRAFTRDNVARLELR